MWPCWWSAMLAANVAASEGTISPGRIFVHLILFAIGAIAMRGAGCTWNDLVDHKIDAQVARTRSRPLPAGRISRKAAYGFIAAQAFIGLLVLLQFNLFAILLGISSLIVVAAYPFAKRVTNWPQFVLGLAFSWGALMGWAAEFGSLALAPVLLYAAAITWTIGYDTIYAHQDKEDDALVGVKSTARLFGENTWRWMVVFYGAFVVLTGIAFALSAVSLPAWIGLAVVAAMLGWQIARLEIDDPDSCLALFKTNSRVGLVLFFGLLVACLWTVAN